MGVRRESLQTNRRTFYKFIKYRLEVLKNCHVRSRLRLSHLSMPQDGWGTAVFELEFAEFDFDLMSARIYLNQNTAEELQEQEERRCKRHSAGGGCNAASSYRELVVCLRPWSQRRRASVVSRGTFCTMAQMSHERIHSSSQGSRSSQVFSNHWRWKAFFMSPIRQP